MRKDKKVHEELSEEKKKLLKILRIVIQALLLGGLLAVCIIAVINLYPIFMRINNDEIFRQEIVDQISSTGGFSWIILIGIQIIQAVLAVIPAGPVVIITGMIYNPFVATIICLVGQTIGAIIVIYLVKLFGYTFISLFIDPEQTKKFKILQDGKRCGVLMFSYLLIPLLPKDPIAFIVPFTKVKVKHFIWINLVARTPMTIVSVIFGNSLMTGEYLIAIILGVICAILALLCFIFNKRIVDFIDKLTIKKECDK